MRTLELYDPAMCCPTGICGVDVDPALVQCNADLQWLAEQGVAVRRYNLAQDPQIFAANAAVLAELNAGMDRLPVTLIDGALAATGRYLARAELAERFGLSPTASPSPFRVSVGGDCCKPESGCCG
jgi:hypothetical protein